MQSWSLCGHHQWAQCDGWGLQVAGFSGSPVESSGPKIRNTVPKRTQVTWQFRWHPLLGSALLIVCFTDSWASWDPFGVSDYEDSAQNNTKPLSAFFHSIALVFVLTWGTKQWWANCWNLHVNQAGPRHQTASSSRHTLLPSTCSTKRRACFT